MVSESVFAQVLTAEQLLVDPQPPILPVLGRRTVNNEIMASPTGREGIFVVGGGEPKKELEDELVRNDVVGLTDHLKGHYLMNSTRS